MTYTVPETLTGLSPLELMELWLHARQFKMPNTEKVVQEELRDKHNIWLSVYINPNLTIEEVEQRLWGEG